MGRRIPINSKSFRYPRHLRKQLRPELLTVRIPQTNLSTAAISLRRSVAGNVRHNPLAATGVVLVILFIIFALFAPWIAPQDPAAIDLPARLSTPSNAHWFGT